MATEKLYKFRPLHTCDDLKRAQHIIKTGKFWCSMLWDLNDPMEGVYVSNPSHSSNFVDKMLEGKSNHILCSFSGKEALKQPLMWGHYANGFRGIAIEIDATIESDEYSEGFYRVTYVPKVAQIDPTNEEEEPAKLVRKVMRTKLSPWCYEHEYRYLNVGKPGMRLIGKVTAVHIGRPHRAVQNEVKLEQFESVRKYNCRAASLEASAREKGIEIFEAHLDGQCVESNLIYTPSG